MSPPFKASYLTSGQVTQAVIDALKIEPRTAEEIAKQIGCNANSIRARLNFLESRRQVHYEKLPRKYGTYYVWHLGPANGVAEPKPAIEASPRGPTATKASQRTVRTWEPIKHRNELETYLFGPAQREAA